MNYQTAKAESARLYDAAAVASAKLNAFPKGPMGLTPDAVKFSPEYRLAKTQYERAAAAVRNFNSTYTKRFAAEIRADRRAKVANG